MAKVGYWVITDAQAAVLTVYGIPFDTLDGVSCVSDWGSVCAAIEDLIWADGEVDDTEGGYLDTLEAGAIYRYWSTEAHSWLPE